MKTNKSEKPNFCKTCGKKIENKNSTYCLECRKKRDRISQLNYQKRRRIKYRICPTCNKEFLVTKENQKYCCAACKKEEARKRRSNLYFLKKQLSKEPKSGK
ncbi:MAG: hypothetical protein LBP57_00050 [Endomicrobium sp.]|nr:hypothetical protein [Endomicrobium sp.]